MAVRKRNGQVEVVVLNCWMMVTNDTPPGIERFDDLGEVSDRTPD